jgi:hypothetical protein
VENFKENPEIENPEILSLAARTSTSAATGATTPRTTAMTTTIYHDLIILGKISHEAFNA